MALYQIFNGIKSSIIPENLVLLTRSEQFWKKSAHIRPTISKTPNSGLEYYELNRKAPGGVFSTKNHQGGLDGTDNPSDGKMFESKGLHLCPVALVRAYLSHLNPKCEALFQKPLTGAKFNPSSDVIWYSAVPLGHNTIASMMTNMSLPAGINPPFTNHCVRSTTVNILSSRNMKIRHIKAVTGHKSDASLESYNNCPTFEQFQDMSLAINDFINLCKPNHQVAVRPLAERNTCSSAAISILLNQAPQQISRRASSFKKPSSFHHSPGQVA